MNHEVREGARAVVHLWRAANLPLPRLPAPVPSCLDGDQLMLVVRLHLVQEVEDLRHHVLKTVGKGEREGKRKKKRNGSGGDVSGREGGREHREQGREDEREMDGKGAKDEKAGRK